MVRALASTCVVLAIAFCVAADEGPKGIPVRPAASDYSVNAQWQHATLAASIVPAKQVEHLFAFDISKSFVVFEVAVYANDEPIRVARQAFQVKVNASGDSIHNADPDTVASAIQGQNQPPMPSSSGTRVRTAATIGVEHGTDPYTRRPVTDVYTGGSATVEQGDRAPVARDPKPGGTYEDRHMLEAQLNARSLPEGAVEHAVAGYLFFRKADLKTQPGNSYALEYLADDNGTGATHAVTLSISRKAR